MPDPIDEIISQWLVDDVLALPTLAIALSRELRHILRLSGYAIVVDEAQALERGREVKLT